MRFIKTTRTLIALSLVAGTVTMWSGCSPKKQTELVPGVSTQVRVPKEMKTVRLDVTVNGQPQFCGIYDVRNGTVRLPRTLGLQSQGKGGPVKVTVTGYLFAQDDKDAPADLANCDLLPSVSAKLDWDRKHPDLGFARVLRSSRQPYVDNRILFVPMPLRFSCFEVPCPDEQTCKAGKCVPNDTDPNTLVDYNDNLILGNSGTCFSPALCMPDAVLPQLVDGATCKYALWKSKGAPDTGNVPFVTTGSGLNVRAYYDDGSVSEILDFDKDEGFFIPDPVNAPQTLQLADGLCHPGPATAHKITGLVASGLCAPKTPLQPLCDEESPSNPLSDASTSGSTTGGDTTCAPIEIKPAPSALVVLMDDTPQMQSFFGQAAAKKVLQLSLGDPVFEKTDLVFAFTPSAKTTCSAGFSPELDGSKTVTASQVDIASLIGSKDPTNLAPPPRALSVALDGAYKKLIALSAARAVAGTAYNKIGVLVLGDGTFDDDCGTGIDFTHLRDTIYGGIATYAVLFGKQDQTENLTGLANAQTLGNAGFFNADAFTPQPKDDTRPNNAADALSRVTQDLASCVYDAPDALKGTGSVTYLNPLPPAHTVAVAFNANCSGATQTTEKGWNLETVANSKAARVRVCGTDCTSLQDVLKTTAALALNSNQAPPAVPIYVQSCSSQTATPSIDGGAPPKDASAGDSAPPPDAGTDSGPVDASGG